MFSWLKSSPRWTGDHKAVLLSGDNDTGAIPDLTLAKVIENSNRFPLDFPVESIRCCQLQKKASPAKLEENVNSAYPIIHEHALFLCSVFLIFQRAFGLRSDFYKGMSLIQLIDRLLSKRAAMFVGRVDHYVLLNGRSGSGNWERVGTKGECPPLVLEDCLSYDEIKLSALLSVSSRSYFINDGDRNNLGRFEENRDRVEDDGVIVGVIGPRFEKPRVMEYRDIVKSNLQNTSCYGYGQSPVPTLQGEFLRFYDGLVGTYDQIRNQMISSERYIDLGRGNYFDKLVYQKRLALSIDTLLLEANDRAKRSNKLAYIHVVGLGLGVWKLSSQQDKIFMDTFAQRLELLSPCLANVSDVRFAYIPEKTAGRYKDGDRVEGVRLHMVDRNPQEKLVGDDEGKLLVVSYPWDGNALPGNEFWGGSLNGSGDPAAACSSQIAELHNWHINPKVSAGNLRVATYRGVVSFREYQQLHKDD